MGIRGDDLTCGLTVDHNVVWDCGSVGIFIKNVLHPLPDQANACVNNTVFGHSAYNSVKTAIIISKKAGKKPPTPEPQGEDAQAGECPNAWSVVANNLADSIYGQWNAQPLGKLKLASNNDTGFQASRDLVNKDWNDFRPVSDAAAIVNKGIAIEGLSAMEEGRDPDIGAYEHDGPVYWIPGQRLEKASSPIVPDHATDVPADRDVLMWRPAYEAVSHRVVFSTSEAGLNETSAATVQKTFSGDENVFPLPNLKPGATYFWRVDAVKEDKSEVAGDVWTFTTKATP